SLWSGKFFDWADVYVVLAASLAGDVEVVPETLFTAGIRAGVRRPTAANGWQINVRAYSLRLFGLALRHIPLWQLVGLLPELVGHLRGLHEAGRAAEKE